MPSFHRTLSRAAAAVALTLAAVAHAQSGATASAPVAIDGDKQKLIDRVLALWHPENLVVMAVQRPAAETMERSRAVLQQAHLPADKLDKAMKDIATDVQKYVDAAAPLASASAKKNVSASIVPLLAQNFSNDELRQLIAMLESPVKNKFEKLIPQFDNALGKRVQDDAGAEINKDIAAMTQAVGAKLRAATASN